MPNTVYAQSQAISSGLNWLNSTQSPDGSWDSTTATTDSVQATSAAMESLAALNNASGPIYVNAANWLTVQQIDTTRYLSDRLKILATSSADKNLILSYADELSRAWGGYDDFTVNNLDTALALQALKAANYSDLSVINAALAYLTASQNPDGGWGFRPSTSAIPADPSNTYMTAVVSSTLQLFPRTTALASAISRATSYLVAHQNLDGGFGSSPSTVYETALAFKALFGVTTDATVLGRAVNYLTTAQLPNGSWNDDSYSTALALQALANIRPNLSVSSLTLSKPMPQEG